MDLSNFAAKKGFLRRPPRRVTMGTLFGAITLALFISYNAGFLSGKQSGIPLDETLIEKEKITTLEKEKDVLQKELIVAKQNYQIQVEAQKSLSNLLKELEEKNTELMKDMALYQSLNKGSATRGLEIKSFQIFATEQPNSYRYLLILSKQADPQKFVQGTISMTILGKINDKSIDLPVKYIDSAQDHGLSFRFRHLQELAGEITLPEKFVPQGVQCQVIPNNEWPQFQRHFSWVTDNPDVG
ncbi:MAG: hypothetical protein JSS07_00420 [Proteobacteria bacterium]|nr:hypothetical protein [Pseudomonadota bacterium]